MASKIENFDGEKYGLLNLYNKSTLSTIHEYSRRGMNLIKEYLIENGADVTEINNVMKSVEDVKLYSMNFTWGRINGEIVSFRVDLHRPRYDIYISGKKTLGNINFCIQSKWHMDDKAEDLLIEEVSKHLLEQKERYICSIKFASSKHLLSDVNL